MAKTITVSPAYGRDYPSALKADKAWQRGDDFMCETVDGNPVGSYCSIRDFDETDTIRIRFNSKRSVVEFLNDEEKY